MACPQRFRHWRMRARRKDAKVKKLWFGARLGLSSGELYLSPRCGVRRSMCLSVHPQGASLLPGLKPQVKSGL
jgi:hypothetical protein